MAFRDEVAAQIAEAESESATYRGADWCQLSDAEEEVFAIDPARFPRMITILGIFEVFLKIVDPGLYELDETAIEEERQKRPDILEGGHSAGNFQAFAKEYAGLTFREGAAVYAKNNFWHDRQGLTRYGDEPEP